MGRKKGVLVGKATASVEDGYSIVCIDNSVEGIFFGSTLDTSIRPGTYLHSSCRFNVTVPEEPGDHVVLLSLKNITMKGNMIVSFIKVNVNSEGVMNIGLLDSDEEWLPPAHKQFQMCQDGKGFRFLMRGYWYTTNPKEKGEYSYIPASSGNMICKYLFEEDRYHETIMAEKLQELATEYAAEASEIETLKEIRDLLSKDMKLMSAEKHRVFEEISSIRDLLQKESRSEWTFSQIWKGEKSPASSLIERVHEKINRLLPGSYKCGNGESEL